MAPREAAFVVGGAIILALIGWVVAAALHQSRIGGIIIGALIGIGAGIGVWRYLSQKARLRGATTVEVSDTLRR